MQKKSRGGNGNGKTNNGNGRILLSLGPALMITGQEHMDDEDWVTRHDRAEERERLKKKRHSLPTVDQGIIGSLDPEKLLLLKEFIKEKRKASGDKIITGHNCGGLSGLLLSPADLGELREILYA